MHEGHSLFPKITKRCQGPQRKQEGDPSGGHMTGFKLIDLGNQRRQQVYLLPLPPLRLQAGFFWLLPGPWYLTQREYLT